MLEDVAAWIDCRIYQRVDAGDHLLVLGEVLELSVPKETEALVFHRGVFRPIRFREPAYPLPTRPPLDGERRGPS